MPIRCSPDEERPTHHLAITDKEGRQMGLVMCNERGKPSKFGIKRSRLQSTSLKISEGNPKYSDFELPFTPIAQESWDGGRGQEQFEKDVTKFFDSYRMNTRYQSKAFLGGLERLTTGSGLRSQQFNLPGNVRWHSLLTGARKYLAIRFQANGAWTSRRFDVILKKHGTPGTFTYRLLADSTGNPGSALYTKTFAATDIPDTLGVIKSWTDPTGYTLVNGTYYWVEVYGASTDNDSNHWRVAVNDAVGTTKESANGSSWAASAVDLYYRLGAMGTEDTPYLPFFYEYKGAEYLVYNQQSGAPKLFLNGDRGAADSNSGALGTLVDATKAWATNQWAGCTVWITEGPGSLETVPFRTIVSNTGTALTLDTPWVITHTTTTEYAILGADTWTEITGHGLAQPVRAILVINQVVYYAMGDGTGDPNIRRHREYNNAGTWTASDWADDSTNKATFLTRVNDATNGLTIWRATNTDVKIASAPPVTWGTSLTFTDKGQVGDVEERITAITEYIDPDSGAKVLWVIKTGSVYVRKGTLMDKIPLDEMRAVMNPLNGKAVLTHNVYLYFSMLFSVERFFNNVLDDVGPVQGRGLPVARRGPISCMVGYPGRWFASIDAGATGYSSILGNNGSGWHEEYRSTIQGLSITNMRIQVVPGPAPDRLWFNLGPDVYWLPLPTNTIDPTQDALYPYAWEGSLELSRVYVGLQNLKKLFDSIELGADNLVADGQWIEVDYKLDDEANPWLPIAELFETSPNQEEPFSQTEDVRARWIMVRLRLNTSSRLLTPILRLVILNAVSRIPIRYGWAPNVRLRDHDKDLCGEPDDFVLAQDKLDLLDEWAEGLEPLTLSSILTPFHGKRVFLEGPEIAPFERTDDTETLEGWLASVPMNQVQTRAQTLADQQQ